ncbi:MAG TPA: DUF6090 family protein [Balneolaceae bacterium]|nr:DUF6090 family protein [Balneolaceae bacterium]
MPTIFKKIRRKLAEENKVKSYLLYAFGEILLVVIGILIALQVNNWNEYRLEREQEQELLLQLQSEYTSNLEQLNEKIALRNTMIHASKQLLDFIDHPEHRNIDSTYIYIGQTLLNPTFDPIVNDIISSGRIELLLNAELRKKLTRWTSDVVQVTEEEVVWTKFTNGIYRSDLKGIVSKRTIFNRFWKADILSSFQLDQKKGTSLNIGDSKQRSDINLLFNSKKFEDDVAQCLSAATLTNSQSYSLRNRIKEILTQITDELHM